MRLLLATTNPNKVREIRAVLESALFDVVSLSDLPPVPEPEETGATFWENARLKAFAYAEATAMIAAAEDSGLEIAALDGEPGVRSARFLGPDVPYVKRFEEIYRRLAAVSSRDRNARFVTALAIANADKELLFETETTIDGVIADAPAGSHGFGYDPIFYYPPFGKTTAELTMEEKCAVSHRARAFRNFALWHRQRR